MVHRTCGEGVAAAIGALTYEVGMVISGEVDGTGCVMALRFHFPLPERPWRGHGVIGNVVEEPRI